MSGYFEEADPRRIAAEYPIGGSFLSGPARLSADALRALQERRFLAVVERAWEVPFYARRWREAGLGPRDVTALEHIERLPTFTKRDLMASVEAHPPLGDFHGIPADPDERPHVVLHTTSGTRTDESYMFHFSTRP